jgi:phosphonate transport system permease protein
MDPRFQSILSAAARRKSQRLGLLLLLMALLLLAGRYTSLLNFTRLREGVPSMVDLAKEMWPPDFSAIGTWWKPIVDTLAMSVAGTALAVFFSLPLAFLAARNTSPHPVVYAAARSLLSALRSIPELVMGIIFVAAVGFGALPGVLALGFHSIGMVGKLFSEAIEHADPGPVEAITAAGATRLQVQLHGVLAQVHPQLLDVVIYRWEYNFRASTVLGAVGAGGIGFELIASLRIMRYQEMLAIVIAMFAAVLVVDTLGASLRKALR